MASIPSQRLQSAGGAADGMGDDPVDSAVSMCPQKCAAMWADVNAERDKVLNSSTDIEKRNAQISAAYARLYQQNPQNTWVGLAAIVSRQAGCAMQHADKVVADARQGLDIDNAEMQSPLLGDAEPGVGLSMAIHNEQLTSAQTAKDALGDGNKAIFSSIYPVALATQKYGASAVQQCPNRPPPDGPIPSKVLDALPGLSSDDPIGNRASADALANYEQADIIQSQVYSVPRYSSAFEMNQLALKLPFGIGKAFGALPPEVSLSSQCGGPTVPFDGSIMNVQDRLGYYGKLIGQFNSQPASWKQQTFQDIVNQARQ